MLSSHTIFLCGITYKVIVREYTKENKDVQQWKKGKKDFLTEMPVGVQGDIPAASDGGEV